MNQIILEISTFLGGSRNFKHGGNTAMKISMAIYWYMVAILYIFSNTLSFIRFVYMYVPHPKNPIKFLEPFIHEHIMCMI